MSVPYLIASLPALSLDAPPALSPEDFLDACGRSLAPSQAAAVAAVLDGSPCDHPFVRAWRDRDTQIRNAVARRRAAKRGLDAQAVQRPAEGCDVRAVQAVEAAFDLPDPLQRERAIDRVRWTVLDDLQGPQPMTFDAVLAYAARLRIVSRWARFDAAAGEAFLKGIARLDAEAALGGADAPAAAPDGAR